MTAVIVIVVIVVIVIVAVAVTAEQARRRRLRQQFGPEFDRAVEEQSGTLRAEAELANRQRRVRKLNIRPLSEEARLRYAADWQTIQENFVDAPQRAVTDAYELVTNVMAERGYPAADDVQAMSDLSVDHAQTVGHFRSAREVTQRVTASPAVANGVTEELRQALIHYRALFEDLLGEPGVGDRGTVVADPLQNGAVTDTAEPIDRADSIDTVPATRAPENGAYSAEDDAYLPANAAIEAPQDSPDIQDQPESTTRRNP